MKKALMVLTAFGFLIFFNSIDKVSASGFSDIEVKSNAESVQIEWNSIADYYKIYKNDKMIYEGSKLNHLDRHVDKNNSYKYKVLAFDENDKIVDEVLINANTGEMKNISPMSVDFNEQLTDYFKSEFNADAIITADSVKLDWPDVYDGKYEIYRDDTFIRTTTKSVFLDKSVEPGQAYNYTVKFKQKLTENELQEVKRQVAAASIKWTPQVEKELGYKEYQIIRFVNTLDNEEMVQSQAITGGINAYYRLRYTTFIPTATAPDPFGVITGGHFGGDNRGFSATSSKFRTRSDIDLTWGSSSQTITPYYYTNPTNYYDKNGNLLSSRKASTAGMSISNISKSSSKISYTFFHDVGIPYYTTVTPDINYYYNAVVNSSGSFTIRGEHDRAPSHEFYFLFNGVYNKILSDSNSGFEYLMPFFPNTVFYLGFS